MIEVLLGNLVDNDPRWSEIRGQLVYADRKHELLWIFHPRELKEDYAGLLFDGTDYVRLGHLDVALTDGCLSLFRLETAQSLKIEGLKGFDSITNDPSKELPENIALSQSLHEYVHADDQNPDTLHSIAWYTSSRIATIKKDGLSRAFQSLTLEDLANHLPAYIRHFITRDPHLFEELRNAVKARRLAFILGGMKSGLSVFLDQFKNSVTAQAPVGDHVSADFDPGIFEEIQSFLDDINRHGLFGHLGCDLETFSLFIALAYAAYLAVLDADGVDHRRLALFVPPRAVRYSGAFASRYITQFEGHTQVGDIGTDGSQVEAFLLFLGELMANAGKKTGTLTVVLSFPSLTNWLREIQGHETAARVGRSLWRELKDFTNANYETLTGQPKPGSVMSRFGHDVGVIVEMRRLPLPDVGEAFCRLSVLTMPPFSNDELAILWQQRTQASPTQQILEQIRGQTGGAPWFVDLLMDCFDVLSATRQSAEATVEGLKSASELARNIILDRAITPTQPQIEILRQRWRLYVEDLSSRMSAPALTDKGTLLNLVRASDTQLSMPKNLQASQWLESGLIWLKDPTRLHTLAAFNSYPIVRTFRQPELISLLIKSLTTPEPRMEKVS